MTTTIAPSLQKELDKAQPGEIADILRLIKLGTMLTPLKRTFTGLTAAAAFDLTAIDGTGETVGAANPNRLAALIVGTLRVTAVGTGATGPRVVTDAGGTPAAPTTATGIAGAEIGLATISDDGKTITFEGTVTGFVIEYIPRASSDMTTVPSGSGIGGTP